MRRREFPAALAGLGLLLTGGSVALAQAPPNGPVLVDYTKGESTFDGKEGVFYDPDDPPEESFVQAEVRTLPIPGGEGGVRGFLSLNYIVEGRDKFNGHWWKYAKAPDWTEHANDSLVLRVSKGEKCTPRFKVEVKASDRQGGPLTTFRGYVWIGDAEHARDIDNDGYTEVAVPLAKLKCDPMIVRGKLVRPTLKDVPFVHELVVVLERSKIDAKYRTGELLLNQLRLEAARANAAADKGAGR